VRLPENGDDLEQIINEARADQKELFVYFCGHERAKEEFSELHTRVTASSDFEKVEEIKGLERPSLYAIYKLK